MKRQGAIALAALLWATSAQGARVFLSPQAANPNWHITGQQTFLQGASASLYVWVIPDAGETLNGLSLSLTAVGDGSVSVQNHSIFQPALSGGRARWDGFTVQDPQTLVPPPPPGTPGGVLNQGDYLFRDWNASALIVDTPIPGYTANLGLDADNAGQDPLRDANSGAFLHSRLDFSGGSVGQLQLFLEVGSRGISSHLAGYDTVFFGSSTTAISGGSIGFSDGQADAVLRVVGTLGDADGDGVVGLTDLNWVRNNFGASGLGDTDGDGLVQLSDLNNVRNNFGAAAVMPVGSPRFSAVPEPGGLLLAGFGVAGIFGFFGWRGCTGVLESDSWSGRAGISECDAKEDRPLQS